MVFCKDLQCPKAIPSQHVLSILVGQPVSVGCRVHSALDTVRQTSYIVCPTQNNCKSQHFEGECFVTECVGMVSLKSPCMECRIGVRTHDCSFSSLVSFCCLHRAERGEMQQSLIGRNDGWMGFFRLPSAKELSQTLLRRVAIHQKILPPPLIFCFPCGLCHT